MISGVVKDATAGAACEVAVGVPAFAAAGTTAAIGVVAGTVTEGVGETGRLTLLGRVKKCLWQCLW